MRRAAWSPAAAATASADNLASRYDRTMCPSWCDRVLIDGVGMRLIKAADDVRYAAYDPELDRKVALKLLLPHRTPNSDAKEHDARARLLREARSLAKLNHPNVVAVHDAGTVGERVWIAMEFVEGQTLHQWLETGPGRQGRPWTEIVTMMTAAGRGLAAAHAAITDDAQI